MFIFILLSCLEVLLESVPFSDGVQLANLVQQALDRVLWVVQMRGYIIQRPDILLFEEAKHRLLEQFRGHGDSLIFHLLAALLLKEHKSRVVNRFFENFDIDGFAILIGRYLTSFLIPTVTYRLRFEELCSADHRIGQLSLPSLIVAFE